MPELKFNGFGLSVPNYSTLSASVLLASKSHLRGYLISSCSGFDKIENIVLIDRPFHLIHRFLSLR